MQRRNHVRNMNLCHSFLDIRMPCYTPDGQINSIEFSDVDTNYCFSVTINNNDQMKLLKDVYIRHCICQKSPTFKSITLFIVYCQLGGTEVFHTRGLG
jgi:hypothetical protein